MKKKVPPPPIRATRIPYQEPPPTPVPYQEPEQVVLFDKGDAWEEAWGGMPEFAQEDQAPWKTIYVHFDSREDMDRFAKLVEQTITLDTRSIWYPAAEIGHFTDKRYRDPSEPRVEKANEFVRAAEAIKPKGLSAKDWALLLNAGLDIKLGYDAVVAWVRMRFGVYAGNLSQEQLAEAVRLLATGEWCK